MLVMEMKPRQLSRKGTWSLPLRKPTLPPLQEHHAEEEDYPVFDSNGVGAVKQSIFARIFSIKPLSQVIQTTLSADRLRKELVELLQRWESMGIGITKVVEDPRTQIVRAKLQSHNSVGLKAMKFRIQVVQIRTSAANAVFTQEKGDSNGCRLTIGAGSSFMRVVQQVDAVLCGKGYLVSGSSTEKAIPPLTPRLPGIEV
jgi:Fungal kinase associated-1 domain